MGVNKLVLTGEGFVHLDKLSKVYYSWEINKLQVVQITPRHLRGFLERHPDVVEKGYDLVLLDHYWYSGIVGPEYSK